MRKESSADRAAWTSYVEGTQVARPSKYGNVRSGKYASKKEAEVAGDLAALAGCGEITELREQVSYTLVAGQGKIRAIRWIADFVYRDRRGIIHVCDVKGFKKNAVYRLKKRLLFLLHGIEIEEL